MVEIRLAQKEELDQVNRLRAQVAGLHSQNRPDVYPPFSPEQAEELLMLWENQEAEILVALLDGAVAGYAVALYRDQPASPHNVPRKVCHIEEFGVDEACRRQKIGLRLFEALKNRAAEKGFRQMQLNVWCFNRQALDFYQAMGFRPFRYSLEYRQE